MLRFISIGCTTLTVLALASCSKPAPPEVTTPAPSVAAVKPAAKPGFDAKAIAGFKAIQGVVSKTETAVEAGNFAAATKDFEGFETNWKTIEDGVMKASPAFYKAVEKAAESAEAGLKAKDKSGTIKALKELHNTLQSAS